MLRMTDHGSVLKRGARVKECRIGLKGLAATCRSRRGAPHQATQAFLQRGESNRARIMSSVVPGKR